MQRVIVLPLCAFLFTATTASPEPKPSPSSNNGAPLTFADIRHMFPAGMLHVDMMGMQLAPRTIALGNKVDAAMKKNPEWFKAHKAEMDKNQMPPYDARMGLTPSEFKEFAVLSKRGPEMVKAGESEIHVAVTGSTLTLVGVGRMQYMNGLIIDTAKNEVSTPYCKLAKIRDVKPTPYMNEDKWNGMMWQHGTEAEVKASGAGSGVTFAGLVIGKYVNAHRGLMIYHMMREYTPGRVKDVMTILRFDIPR